MRAFLQNMRNKTMTNEQVIERLVQDNWVITCTIKQDVNSVLQA